MSKGDFRELESANRPAGPFYSDDIDLYAPISLTYLSKLFVADKLFLEVSKVILLYIVSFVKMFVEK